MFKIFFDFKEKFKALLFAKIANALTDFQYLSFVLKLVCFPLGGKDFPPFNLWLVRILRNMKGAGIGGDDCADYLSSYGRRLRFLQVKEGAFFQTIFLFPNLFISYLMRVLIPANASYLDTLSSDRKLFMVHNFVGARVGIFAAALHLLKKGENAVVLGDYSAVEMVRRCLKKKRRSREDSQGDVEVFYGDIFKDAGSNNSKIIFLNAEKKDSLFKTLRFFRRDGYHVMMIPESNGNYKSRVECSFLNSTLAIPAGMLKLMNYTDELVSIVPDSREFVFCPELSVVSRRIDKEAGERERKKILLNFIRNYEPIVYYNPFLYVPFDYSSLWKDLYVTVQEKEEKILFTSFHNNRCLMLLSDGKMVVFQQKEYQKVVQQLQTA